MSARPPAAPPDIPGFRYLELLGRGGFADVFGYEQLGLGRRVAVKVMLEGITSDSQALFESEANVMAQLSNHPSIVSIYQAGAAPDGRPFLVMEYCPPPHLATRMRNRPLPVGKALEVGVQIAGAAESAHRIGVLHRDIKPPNILFTEFGRPALTDFGISVTAQQEGGGVNGLSVAWAPPEQIEGDRPTDASADVYSLAATVWASLVGHGPFVRRGERNDDWTVTRRVRQERVPRTRREDVPVELERVLATAMGKRPEQRYATAMEFARALQQVQAQQRMSVTPIDVREEQATVTRQIVEGGTRVSSFVVIDPEAPARHDSRSRPSAAPTERVSAPSDSGSVPTGAGDPPEGVELPWGVHDEGDTVVRRGAGDEPPDPSPTPGPERRARRMLGLLAAAIALVALGVAAVIAVPRLADRAPGPGGPSSDPTRSANPQDPLGEVVPAPQEVRVRIRGGRAVVRWTNPEPRPRDSFLVQVRDVPLPPPERVDGRRLVVPATAGRTCVEVSLVRENGRASVTPAAACSE